MTNRIQNAVSLGISADTSTAQRELRQMDAVLRQIKEPSEQLNQTLRHLKQTLDDGDISGQRFNDAVLRAGQVAERQASKIRKLREEMQALNKGSFAVGLANVGTSKVASELRNAKAGADAFSAGLRAISDSAARSRKEIEDLRASALRNQEALTGWANGLKRVGTSKIASELRDAKVGADAFTAGLDNMRRASEAAARAQRELAEALRIRKRDQARANRASFLGELDNSVAQFNAGEAEVDRRRREGLQFLRQFETHQEGVNGQLREAKRLYDSGAVSGQEYERVIKNIKKTNSLLSQSFTQFRTAFLSLVGPIVVLVKAWEGLKASIKLTADLAEAKAKFDVLTGSAEQAVGILERLRALSSTAPISFAGAQRATATMLQFGVESRNVIPALRQIAEITGGNTERMESLSLAYGQAQAAGRLMGQEIIQMVNAGFNPLLERSRRTGESMRDLKKQVEDGGFGFDLVAKEFKIATEEGGRFNGMLDKISQTSKGQMVRTTNQLEKLGTAFGQLVEPGSVDFLERLTGELRSVTEAIDLLNKHSSDVKAITSLDLAGTVNDAILPLHNISSVLKVNAALARKWSGETFSLEQKIADLDLLVRESEGSWTEWLLGSHEMTKRLREESERLNGVLERRLVSSEQFKKDKAEFLRDVEDLKKAGADNEDIARRAILFYDNEGSGFFTGDQTKEVERIRDIFSEIDAAKERIDNSFGKAIEDKKEEVTKAQYGDDSGRVQLLLDQAGEAERKILDALVDQEAAYQDIFNAANKNAQIKATDLQLLEEEISASKRLEDLRKAADKVNEKAAGDLEGIQNEIAYQKDLLALIKDEAEIRKLMREEGFSRGRSAEIVAAQRELDLLNKAAKAAEEHAERKEKLEKDAADAERKKEEYFADQRRNLDDTINYQRDLLNLTREEAEVRKLMREDELTREQAEDLVRKQKELDKLKSPREPAPTGAPRALQAGSREAFSAQVDRQALAVQQQIKLQQQQLASSEQHRTISGNAFAVLEDIRDKPGVSVA